MILRQILLLAALGFSLQIAGQNCGDPIVINSILVSNTTCSNATGTIIITPTGPSSAFTFTWTPAVSTSNVGSNLVAGTYAVHIVRANDPNCVLDTIIVMNNSNGPQVQAAIDPADCFAANGSVVMSPSNLLYNWSNGAGTSTVQGLAAGTYYVTATNPNNGCYSVNKIVVPRSFDFSATATILSQAKCGQNTGQVQIVVAQGSGQYSYSLGAGPIFSGLAPASYTCVVTDIVTGCTSVVPFTIENLSVSADVSLVTHDLRCAGGNNGTVDINVTPGPNFKLPYIVNLVNTNGVAQSPGNLPAGTYYLQISDADQCSLPPDTIVIHEPPPISISSQTSPESCVSGGAITLNISGGTGAYSINWPDLPGNINPQNRINLAAGLYSVVVSDSLFCSKTFNNLLIAPLCNNSDTTFMVIKANTTDFFCWKKPVGLAGNATTFSLLGGGNTGNSSFGAWVLGADGCLSYTAGPNAGFAVDTICMLRTASQIGLQDTMCVVVSITTKQPTKQSVFFTVQTNQSIVVCGTIPPLFGHYTLVQVNRPGLTGTSGDYGQYSIDEISGCLSFFASDNVGFSVDEIRVAAFDTLLNESHIICYLPSVIQAVDCSTVLQLADTLPLFTTDCDALASGCFPIPFNNIVNYSIIDNGVLYNSGYNGCDPKPTQTYTVNALPSGGAPYQLNAWMVNGQPYSGNFNTVSELVLLMNQLDPNQGWVLQGAGFIRNTNTGINYGTLSLRSFTGVLATFNPVMQQAFFGTALSFNVGTHKVVVRNVLNACSDTVTVAVDCFDCQPVHNYSLDGQGNVRWDYAGGCIGDTVFCTSIPLAELSNYNITDNNSQFIEYTNCGNNIGIVLDTGFHLLHFVHEVSSCEYYVRVYVDCQNLVVSDTLDINLAIGEETIICLDTTLLAGTIVSLDNTCGNDGGFTLFDYSFNTNQWCVTITGLSIGEGNLCLQLCDNLNQCATYIIHINVTGSPTDSLLAVDDQAFTLINTDVEIPIIENDIVDGILGNRFALLDIEFLSQPNFGFFSYSQITGLLTYSPNQGECGIDSIRYRITNTQGKQSVATIIINVVCEKVLVFNGISPNGDGKNDTWHILGIEQFPSNVVQVFNRWGNQVFEQKGYTNANAWDGTWNGKALPDGTYFYILQLGGPAGRLDGYLQIMR